MAPAFWLSGSGLVFSILCNFYNVNTTVSMFSQLQMMPPYESSVIIGNLLSGGIVMNEFDFYDAKQITLIFIGTVICVFGIFYKVLKVEMISEKLSIVYNMEDDELPN